METGPRKLVNEKDLHAFILDNIDTVPHLEALLLVWNSRPHPIDKGELVERLFVKPAGCRSILADLARRSLVKVHQGKLNLCSYLPSPDNDRFLESLAYAYRTDLIGISTLIHSKASPGIREFARAFEFNRKGKKT